MSAAKYPFTVEAMADAFGMTKSSLGNGKYFRFKEENKDGWFTEFIGEEGLYVSSMWFTPATELIFTVDTRIPFFLWFSIDCGDITIKEKRKPSKHLTPINHIYINPFNSFELVFPAGIHTCLTFLIVYEAALLKLTDVPGETPLRITDLREWPSQFYNTPDITNILEQMKWSSRNGILPLFYYPCKFKELYALILKNKYHLNLLIRNRRYHISWENEQKLYRIKEVIDSNVLKPPSISSLAMSEALSISKLHRCFKKLFHMTIAEYIHAEKMKRAMLLMANDELNIKNIANRCGYVSASKFTCAFKEAFGVTPSQYRKAHNL